MFPIDRERVFPQTGDVGPRRHWDAQSRQPDDLLLRSGSRVRQVQQRGDVRKGCPGNFIAILWPVKTGTFDTQNVEKFFAVVGVLEDLDVSLQVLESYLPRYFSGAKAVLATNPAIRHVNRNIYKQEQSEEFRKMIRTRVI